MKCSAGSASLALPRSTCYFCLLNYYDIPYFVSGSDCHDKHIHTRESIKHTTSFDENHNDLFKYYYKNSNYSYMSNKNCTQSKCIKVTNYYSLTHLLNFTRNYQSNIKLCQESVKQRSATHEKPVKVPTLNDGKNSALIETTKEKLPKLSTEIKSNEIINKKDNKSSDLAPALISKAKKPSIGKRIIAELKHFYDGFRLLFYDIYISSTLLLRLAKGQSLRRREKKLVSIK